LTTNFAWSSRLVMEYIPCDKSFGWNWWFFYTYFSIFTRLVSIQN
jgi:hypothetical protein